MARVLILYASHHGQTRKVALALADVLRAHQHRADVADIRDWRSMPPPRDYDAVVVGSRVELGRHAHDALAYISAHRAALRCVPTAFFSVSMAAAQPRGGADPEGYLAKTFAQLDWQPVLAAAFAGGLPYRQYGPVTRLIMRLVARAGGHPTDTSRDHELTSWPEVTAFADKIAYIAGGRVATPAPSPPQARTN